MKRWALELIYNLPALASLIREELASFFNVFNYLAPLLIHNTNG